MPVRPPTPIRIAALAALVALLLASCGGPTPPEPTPTPTPTLALTGASPDVALPGATVTLTGTGFDEDRAVTFDGRPATVLEATDTTLTVVVPEAYGYPTIAVDTESADGLLFVGSEHAGATNLDAVQASLDALPAGAALRLPAGTYGAPGTGLTVDNRSLYGVGSSTILELDAATGLLLLFARLPHGASLTDLTVANGQVHVAHGRLTTTQTGPSVPLAPARFERVALDVADFGTPSPVVGTAIEIVGTSATATTSQFLVGGGALRIEGSAFDLAAPWVVVAAATAVEVRTTTIEASALQVVVEDTAPPVRFVGVAASTAGAIQLVNDGAIEIEDAAFDAADVVVVGTDGVAVAGSTLTSDGQVVLQSEGSTVVTDSSASSVASTVLVGLQGIGVTGTDLTSATADVVLQSQGAVAVRDATLAAATSVVVFGDDGGVVVTDSDVAATTASVNLNSNGPVLVDGGAWSAGTDLVLVTQGSAGAAIRGATSITAGSTLVLADTASVALAGSGGTVAFEANGPTTAAAFVVTGGLSDVVVRGNAPVDAGTFAITTTAAHVDVHDNESLASTSDLTVVASDPGARVSATGNAFVADEVAGTILIQSEPGTLTLADNTYLAFSVDLVGE